MFGERDLPISEERLAELRDPLSDEARMVLELTFQVTRGNLEEEERDATISEVHERLTSLPEDDQRQLAHVGEELQKAYGRQINEDKAFMSLAKRSMADLEKAKELDPSVNTTGEAFNVLKQRGIEPQVTEDELNVEVQVPVEESGWISIPESEMDTDENGVPTKQAARQGWAINGLDKEDEIIKISSKETEAMRLLAKHIPYREQQYEHREEMQELVDEFRQAFSGQGLDEDVIETQAQQVAINMSHRTYLQSLLETIRREPELQGFIDYHKGKDTAAARRYRERAGEEAFNALFEKEMNRMIEEGIFEVVPGTGGKKIRPGPNYEEWEKARKEESGEENDL